MGTFTAQILLGHAHPYHGGIQPTHQMFLSENDRPAWVLYGFGERSATAVCWIPTVQHMLEDGLLLLGTHVLKDSRLLELLPPDTSRFACGDMRVNVRRRLLGLCREGAWQDWKVVATVLDGSSIARQCGVLSQYSFQVETNI